MQHSSGSTDDTRVPTPEERAGQELRKLRISCGWSQEEVAQRMSAYGYEWHQTLVGRIEAAQRPLRLNEAMDLATLYGVPVERLLRPVAFARPRGYGRVLDARIEAAKARLEKAHQACQEAMAGVRAAEADLERLLRNRSELSS